MIIFLEFFFTGNHPSSTRLIQRKLNKTTSPLKGWFPSHSSPLPPLRSLGFWDQPSWTQATQQEWFKNSILILTNHSDYSSFILDSRVSRLKGTIFWRDHTPSHPTPSNRLWRWLTTSQTLIFSLIPLILSLFGPVSFTDERFFISLAFFIRFPFFSFDFIFQNKKEKTFFWMLLWFICLSFHSHFFQKPSLDILPPETPLRNPLNSL